MPDTGPTTHIVRKRQTVVRAKVDRRVERTLKELLRAFVGLVTERNYRSIKVSDIVERANVGRSTFYDHFRTKDEILLTSMGWILEVLSDTVSPDQCRETLDDVVRHFWANRQLGRIVLAPPIEPKIRRALAASIEGRLSETLRYSRDPTGSRIAAVSIAAGQLGLLEAWTRGEVSADADLICDMIWEIARR